MSEKWSETEWLVFIEEPVAKSKKTRCWQVRSKRSDLILGWIGWYSRWRQYCFMPESATIYNRQCLRDLADFCDRRTKEHMNHVAMRAANSL